MRLDPFSLFFSFVLILGAMVAAHEYTVGPPVGFGDAVPLEPLVDAVDESARDGPMAGLPLMSQVVTAAMWGIDFDLLHTKSDQDEALSTTPIEAFDEDLPAPLQTATVSQNIRIRNGDDADVLCVGSTGWGDTCGAGDMTCRSGAVTDGNVIYPGETRSLRYQGDERPCIQGSGAIATYDAERTYWQGSGH